VQPPERHCTEQEAVEHVVLQGAVEHCTVQDLREELWELAQNPFAQSVQVSL
jgi:hypothetical protein